jgi:hypothetical protein
MVLIPVNFLGNASFKNEMAPPHFLTQVYIFSNCQEKNIEGMAEQTDAVAGVSDQIVASTELASTETCVNCICLQSQLSKAIEELKSLQIIISLLQNEDGQSCTDSKQSDRGKTNSFAV